MPQENKIASLQLQLAKEGVLTSRQKTPDIVIPKSRFDSWANETTQFGIQHATNNTKFFKQNKKLEFELVALYEDDWATRKGVDMPAEDMVRKGISFLHNDEDENGLEVIENLEDILVNEWQWAKIETESIKFERLSGGCATFFNFGGTEEDQRDPIEQSQIREIRSIRNFPSWKAIPLSWYNEFGHPKQGHPEHYQLIFIDPSSSRTVIVHESRLLIRQGDTVSPSTKAFNRGWNDSPIQSVYNALRDFGVASSAVSGIMQDFNWFSLGIAGLADMVMHQDDDSILERLYLARQKLHSGNISLYDAEHEQMARHGTPVTGLPELWDRSADILCAAWHIPRSLYFFSESGDLGGNSSEADRSNYYDRISSKQEIESRPWKNNFIHFVSLINGIDDSSLKYIFNPLNTKTDKERYEEQLFVAEKDVLYIDRQVISPQEVAASRFSKSEIDLNTMNLDMEERKEQEELETFTQKNEDTIKELEIEAIKIENKNKTSELEEKENKTSELEEKENPTEKKDAAIQVIEVKPVVNIPIPEIILPEPKNNDELLDAINVLIEENNTQSEDIILIFE